MHLHLVPFTLDGHTPVVSPALVTEFADALFSRFPVTDVVISVGDVNAEFAGRATTPEVIDELGQRLIVIQEQVDEAAPSTYYYGMISGAGTRAEVCHDCTGMMEHGAGHRAGSAVGLAFGDPESVHTMMWWMGRAQGLGSAPCGRPGDVDPAYPSPLGNTLTEGFDVRSGAFVPGSAKDLMSDASDPSCSPRWIGAYSYAKLVAHHQFARDQWSD